MMTETPRESLSEVFQRDGFAVVNMYTAEQMQRLRPLLAKETRDSVLSQHIRSKPAPDGRDILIAEWNVRGPDIFSRIACDRQLVTAVQECLGGEIHVWEHKLSGKDPKVGGSWFWHQDYGYWYYNYLLMPRLASVMIAVDECTAANGPLKVLKGSHVLGRLDHNRRVEDSDGSLEQTVQRGADPEKLEQALARFELLECCLAPGQALIFHCLLLHTSEDNDSEMTRWVYIPCYNRRDNAPYSEKARHAQDAPIEMIEHNAVFPKGKLPGFSETEAVFIEK